MIVGLEFFRKIAITVIAGLLLAGILYFLRETELETKTKTIIAIIAILIVVALSFTTYHITKPEPLTKPSNLKIQAREPKLDNIIKVEATAYPGENTVETEVNVEWTSEKNLAQKDFNVVFKLVLSHRNSESDLALLVGKGEFSVNSYVNGLGKDWQIVDTDSYFLKEIDNTKRFLLTVEFP